MFTREDTKAVKGAAVVLMLAHHLVTFADRYPPGFPGFISLLPGFAENGYLTDLALNAVVCVPLFFFLGGYGLYKRVQAGSFRLWDTLARLYSRYWLVFAVFVPIAFLFFARTGDAAGFTARYVITSPKQFFIDLLGNFVGYRSSFNSEWWFFGAYLCAVPLGCLFGRAIRRHSSFLGDMFLVLGIHILTQSVLPALAATTVFSSLNADLYFTRFFALNKYAPLFFAGIVFARYDALAMIKRRMQPVPCKGLAALLGAAAALLCRTYVTTDMATSDILLVPFLAAFLSLFFDSLWPVKDCFAFLGRHSTNIWLVHTFYCYYFLPVARLCYCTRLVWVDLLVLLGLSLGTALVLDALYTYLGLLWQRLRQDTPAPVS